MIDFLDSKSLQDYVNSCPSCKESLSYHAYDSGACDTCCYEFRSEQRDFALESPELYAVEVTLPNGRTRRVIEIADQCFNGKILALFGLFAVTSEGIESLFGEYFIEKSRLQDDWVVQMSCKSWVNIENFKSALQYAKLKHRSDT